MTQNRIAALQARLNLSPADAARYLGVPRPTFDKWAKGDRSPPAVALRLLDVLALIEMALPEIHQSLIGGE